jgi:hypothetical protein
MNLAGEAYRSPWPPLLQVDQPESDRLQAMLTANSSSVGPELVPWQLRAHDPALPFLEDLLPRAQQLQAVAVRSHKPHSFAAARTALSDPATRCRWTLLMADSASMTS